MSSANASLAARHVMPGSSHLLSNVVGYQESMGPVDVDLQVVDDMYKVQCQPAAAFDALLPYSD